MEDHKMTPRGKKLRPVIGLLGGIAAGKSLVASQFAKLGCSVVDADALGHELLLEPAIRRALVERFGEGILDASGIVDRRLLGRRAFADRDSVSALESILHPELRRRVTEAVERQRRGDTPAVIMDAALILEKGLDRLCDVLVYIEAPEEARRSRAGEARGWEPSEIARREATQVSLKVKQERADYTVDNRTTPEHTFEQVRTILTRILA
jgi:dephospho-CoA kinase